MNMKVLMCWKYDLDLTQEQINQLLEIKAVPCTEEDVIYCYEEQVQDIFKIVDNIATVCRLEDYIKCFDGGSYLQIELSKLSNNHIQIGMDECIKHLFENKNHTIIESYILIQEDREISTLISNIILKEAIYIISEYIEKLNQTKKDLLNNNFSWYIR